MTICKRLKKIVRIERLKIIQCLASITSIHIVIFLNAYYFLKNEMTVVLTHWSSSHEKPKMFISQRNVG